MPPRIGTNGGVVKPSSSAKIQRTARPTASKVIDLTHESTDETSEKSSGAGSAEEQESEDAPERHEEGPHGRRGHQNLGVGPPQSNDHQRVARQNQESMMEDSFIVTSLHHRPWGMGDDNTTIGVFSTEREAKDAASKDFFQRCEREADGWESEWRRLPRDGMLQLCGCCEDGEKDSETYKASIKRVQQKRAVAIQPSVPLAAQPGPRVVKPRHVYLVQEERRINVGADPQGRYNDLGDLEAVKVHGIYVDLDAANDSAREIYERVIKDLAGVHGTVTKTPKNGMATILVRYHTEMRTYLISVVKRSLR